ncbi:MAG: undecaprenyl/decaprenyl-phosphate alpha-N-acetylglucosaminyl 1-phosphate transferase [Treponema sp.]|nr:undecaprenyl/decaprenyl-phosphate alpha-N-acetylglucosaminyl 1-phosphate transferase [Treponema sp.]
MYIFVLLSFVLSLCFMPLIIKFCKKRELYDYQSSRKIHSGNIPRIGGIGIFASFIISTVLFLALTQRISIWDNLPILVAALIIFTCGIIDDLKNLPALVKLLFQLLAVTIVTFNDYRFTQIFGWHLPTILSYILTFGWILGVINAYNLIDGLDGLCGTLTFTALVTLGVLYTLSGNTEANLCFILAGSVLGFLCFNWPPAKIFMGDNGSQFLGFMIATIPLYSSSDVFEYNKFFVMLVLTSFPVFDTVAAIWRRLREKKDIMSPDRSHLHHKLLNLGYTQKHALYLVAIIQVLLSLSVILAHFLGKTNINGNMVSAKGSAILIEDLVFMLLFFGIIHYTNKRYNLQKQAAENVLKEKGKLEATESSGSETKESTEEKKETK